MMWRDDLRCIFHIALKDMKTYYLKPPSISWGILFPTAWVLAFYLRNPQGFHQLVPGLISLTILFSTTAAEAVVINFELRTGSLERLLLAPVNHSAILLGKILGGALFGSMMTSTVALGALISTGISRVDALSLTLITAISLLLFSSLGALLCVLVREVFEAQTLLNIPRFLMVFLSGVAYPIQSMPPALRQIAYLLPLTYTVEGVRKALSPDPQGGILNGLIILTAISIVFIMAAAKLLERRFE